jgi:hypothetical protein
MQYYGRRLQMPANQVLVDSMNRRIQEALCAHPEHADAMLAELEAAEDAARERGEDPARLPSLDQVIANLRQAAAHIRPTVH